MQTNHASTPWLFHEAAIARTPAATRPPMPAKHIGTNRANGRLIAAAPALLAALREFVAAFYKGDPDCTHAQIKAKRAAYAAIAKATGEW